MFKKADTSLDFCAREKEILKFWQDNQIFEKSCALNSESDKTFTFYDGPPTANGKPHIGHILTRVMKDIIPRYKIMKGYSVLRKAGWDTHGLPVELEVEKLLKLDGKQDIEKYGIEPFINKCKESVWKYTSEWKRMSDRVGFWVDMDHPYITYDDNYIESVWWAIKKIHEKGLLYKGHKIVPYCPRCGTALSSHEVAQGYKDVKEKSVFVKFPLKNEENTYFLAWTTTPWTLPSNAALCMNPDENYVKIKADGVYYILAEALVSSLFEEYETVSVKKGREYEYTPYIPLFDYVYGEYKDKAWYVTCDGYVTLTDGTGIVHTAPAFGEDDANVGRKYNLPFIQLVDERGKFRSEARDYAGIFVKDADKTIIADLNAKGLLFKEMLYEHSYPFCWRCDTPLLYYARSSWFIKMTEVKNQLLENNNSVNWMPETIKSGRMGNFLENVIDWGLSRERYWGTPLPVWVCDKCGKIHVMGSKKELKELCGITGDIELHRPYIDAPEFRCECGGTFKRTPEVIDCWFDSGSMPFAQWHYPFENKEIFEKNFPADFISEAVDQTRGWFYTLLAISTLLFGKSPFKNCIVLGHVNDKDGIKMSKHKGNVVDPFSVLDVQGADAVRWYFYTSSAPWLPSRFYGDAVSEAQRKFMGTLWNTYAFFTLYAEIDNFDPSNYDIKNCKLSLLDKWILSGLNTLIKTVDEGLNEYKITESARAIQNFTDELSNWYVRRSRERFWGSGMDDDKVAAYMTLYTVLVTLSKITAPFTPFIAEELYQNLVRPVYKDAPESVHFNKFPDYDPEAIDSELEKGMEKVLDIVVLGRAVRNTANIKNRQPLNAIYVKSLTGTALSEELKDLVKDELNIRNFEFIEDADKFISYELKPQMKTLGPKYGALLPKIREYLTVCSNPSEIVKAVETGVYKTDINGTEVVFAKEDLLISPKNAEGFAAQSEKDITVIIDTNLTKELINEGVIREIVSKIQTMRKEAGFEVMDRIEIGFESAALREAVNEGKDAILSDVLANSVTEGKLDGYLKDWDINGDKITLSVKKV